MLLKRLNPFYSRNSEVKQSDEFTGCSDLPMLNFIRVTTTGDLKHLGRCADPEALWETIHSEYTEMSGDASNQQGLTLAKQITVLTNRINITNVIVDYLLLRGRVDELVQELVNMGYRISFTDLQADLARVVSLSKSDHVKLNATTSAYEKLGTGEKTTEKDWYRMLGALAKHRGVVVINPALITVTEYIVMDLEFRAYCEAMKS